MTPQAAQALRESGYPRLTLPTAHGGLGATLSTFALAQLELGRQGASLALVLAMHLIAHAGLGRPDNPWPKEVRRRVQRSSLAGVALINALRVEPELGTPARGGLPATVAERTDDGWRVDLEVVESRRIPDSTDILATYQVDVDEDGDLTGYHRAQRYVRGKGSDREGGR